MKNNPETFIRIRAYIRDTRGASAVEMALVFPVLAMILFGIFNMCVFFFGVHEAQRVTEQSARDVRMMDDPTDAEIAQVVADRLPAPMLGSYQVSAQRLAQHGGTYADIQISYGYTMDIPFMSGHEFSTTTGTQILLREMN